MRIYRVTKLHFGFHFIAICNGYVPHVIAKAYKFCTLPIVPAGCSSCPGSNIFNHSFILPMAYHYFPIFAHAAYHKTKFAVTMCRLIQVHEIHINRSPWNFSIVLCM